MTSSCIPKTQTEVLPCGLPLTVFSLIVEKCVCSLIHPECNSKNGALEVALGSHSLDVHCPRMELSSNGKISLRMNERNDTYTAKFEDNVSNWVTPGMSSFIHSKKASLRSHDLELSLGDAILLHPRIYHRSGPNVSRRPRR